MTEVNKIWAKCPECGGQVLPVVYGLLASDPDPNQVIMGGCGVSGDEPEAECRSCGWGFEPLNRNFVPLAEFAMPTEERSHMRLPEPIDVSQLDEEELLPLTRTILEARQELIVRGWDPLALEQYCATQDMRFVPLFSRDENYVVYSPESQRAVASLQYGAKLETAYFTFVLPGMDEWDAVFDRDEFDELMDSFDLTNLQIWQIHLPENYDDEFEVPGAENWGSNAIASVFADTSISEAELAKEATQIVPAKLWPSWFDLGNLMNT